MRQRQLNLFDPPMETRPVRVVNSPLLNDASYQEDDEQHWLPNRNGAMELRQVSTADDVNYLLNLRDGSAKVWWERGDIYGFADTAHVPEDDCAHNLSRLATLLRESGSRSGGLGKHYGAGIARSVLITFGIPATSLPYSDLWCEGRKRDLFDFRAEAARDGQEVRLVVPSDGGRHE